MSRDKTARLRVREYLRSHGAVDDPAGYATSALMEAVDYQGRADAFIQLIAAMDREGEIARRIRGKRTYRITLGRADDVVVSAPEQAPAAGLATRPAEIDYDQLARAVVREFFLEAGRRPLADAGTADRDEYALKLELARLQLSALLGDRA